MNNPVSLADWNGMLPGDVFKSEAQAFHDFAKNYSLLSYILGREISTQIYSFEDSDGNTKYKYPVPVADGWGSSYPTSSKFEDETGLTPVAVAHTHADHTYEDSKTFSDGDKEWDKNYLSTADGRGQVYEKGGNPEVKTLFVDLPTYKRNGETYSEQLNKINSDNRPIKLWIQLRDEGSSWLYVMFNMRNFSKSDKNANKAPIPIKNNDGSWKCKPIQEEE